jgi:hypothetical protein
MPANNQAPAYREKTVLIAFDKTLLAAQEFKDQSLFFADDCDVEILALHGTQTGAYQLQLQDPSGRWISSSYINNTNCVGTAASPFVLPRSLVIPAKAKLGINIKDTSAAGNTVQLIFTCLRRERQ